jgi:hypothetical protein
VPSAIQVERLKDGLFRVRVRDADSETTHRVSVRPDYRDKLTSSTVPAEELVLRSFEFLLEHEPKESILAEFDLAVIQRYFPDYEREIRLRLRR